MNDETWSPGSLARTAPIATARGGLLSVLTRYRGTYLVAIAVEWASQALTIVFLVAAAWAVGLALAGGSPAELVPVAVVVVGAVVAKAGIAWLATLVSHRLAYRVLAEIRQWVYWSLERSAPASLLRRRTGDLLSRVMSDAESLEVFYAHALINAIVGVTLPVVVVVWIGVVGGGALALAVALSMIAALVIPAAMLRLNARRGTVVRDRTAAVSDLVVELVDGLTELTLFGRTTWQLGRIGAAGAALSRAQRRYAALGGVEVATTAMLAGLAVVALIVRGADRVADGALAAWQLPALATAAVAGFGPIAALISGTRVAGMLRASARRLFEILRLPPSIADDGTTPPAGSGPARVELSGVTFRYPGASQDALRGVDLDVRPGETLAVVGRSGAGKSTLVQLLLRFYDPASGTIALDGVEVRDHPWDDLVRQIAYVPQDVFCFHDSIAENLRLGAPDATDAGLLGHCEDAGFAGVLDRLPDGLNTIVGRRGARLSGGERQRLAIARALAREARLLIMDEASSQLDALTERELDEAVARTRSRRTTLIVAHRLSTILACDRIAVLDRGRTVDVGTHAELQQRCPVYRELVAAQLAAADRLRRAQATTKEQATTIEEENHR